MSNYDGSNNKRTLTYAAKGELSGRAKLSNQQVLTIRRRYEVGLVRRVDRVTMAELALQYGVSKMQIKRIVHREQWLHLP